MTRERVTISIQDSLVKKIDSLIDKQLVRNRSHAIESILKKGLQSDQIIDAVVFLGGSGARAHLAYLQKPLRELSKVGITTIHVVQGEYGKDLSTDITAFNLKAQLIFHPTTLGSGGGLRAMASQLAERFAFINLTSELDLDWERVIAYHLRYHALVTMMTIDSQTLSGGGIMEKTIASKIGKGFSVLEKDVLPQLVETGDVIIVPSVSFNK